MFLEKSYYSLPEVATVENKEPCHLVYVTCKLHIYSISNQGISYLTEEHLLISACPIVGLTELQTDKSKHIATLKVFFLVKSLDH